jgi:hypothetical protein
LIIARSLRFNEEQLMFTALRDTSRTLTEFLKERFKADDLLDDLFGPQGMVVTANAPQDMAKKPAQG